MLTKLAIGLALVLAFVALVVLNAVQLATLMSGVRPFGVAGTVFYISVIAATGAHVPLVFCLALISWVSLRLSTRGASVAAWWDVWYMAAWSHLPLIIWALLTMIFVLWPERFFGSSRDLLLAIGVLKLAGYASSVLLFLVVLKARYRLTWRTAATTVVVPVAGVLTAIETLTRLIR